MRKDCWSLVLVAFGLLAYGAKAASKQEDVALGALEAFAEYRKFYDLGQFEEAERIAHRASRSTCYESAFSTLANRAAAMSFQARWLRARAIEAAVAPRLVLDFPDIPIGVSSGERIIPPRFDLPRTLQLVVVYQSTLEAFQRGRARNDPIPVPLPADKFELSARVRNPGQGKAAVCAPSAENHSIAALLIESAKKPNETVASKEQAIAEKPQKRDALPVEIRFDGPAGAKFTFLGRDGEVVACLDLPDRCFFRQGNDVRWELSSIKGRHGVEFEGELIIPKHGKEVQEVLQQGPFSIVFGAEQLDKASRGKVVMFWARSRRVIETFADGRIEQRWVIEEVFAIHEADRTADALIARWKSFKEALEDSIFTVVIRGQVRPPQRQLLDGECMQNAPQRAFSLRCTRFKPANCDACLDERLPLTRSTTARLRRRRGRGVRRRRVCR